MEKENPLRAIKERIRNLGGWLEEAAPYAQFDQRHLDAGTVEQAYWHLGYRMALIDVLAMVIRNDENDTPGSASRFPQVDRDE